jgi:hypothetical protein
MLADRFVHAVRRVVRNVDRAAEALHVRRQQRSALVDSSAISCGMTTPAMKRGFTFDSMVSSEGAFAGW